MDLRGWRTSPTRRTGTAQWRGDSADRHRTAGDTQRYVKKTPTPGSRGFGGNYHSCVSRIICLLWRCCDIGPGRLTGKRLSRAFPLTYVAGLWLAVIAVTRHGPPASAMQHLARIYVAISQASRNVQALTLRSIRYLLSAIRPRHPLLLTARRIHPPQELDTLGRRAAAA